MINNIKEIFYNFGTGQVSDAMGKRGVLHGLHPINPRLRMFGTAFTAKIKPGDNLTLHLATKEAKPGDVIVVDGGGNLETALWGELMSLCAKRHEIAGVVIDGAVRDVDSLMYMDFPVYAKGVSPLGPSLLYKNEINVTIVCGGIIIHPGDYVFGDSDGVVVIPANQVNQVIATTLKVQEREKVLKESIEDGRYLYDILEL